MRAGRVPDIVSEHVVLKGAGQYAAMCVDHVAAGVTDSEIRPWLYPEPPDLSKKIVDALTVFWVTKDERNAGLGSRA